MEGPASLFYSLWQKPLRVQTTNRSKIRILRGRDRERNRVQVRTLGDKNPT